MKDYAWHPERCKKNIDGPFYTLDRVCLDCFIPEEEAPTLLCQDEDKSDTYFIKQPANEEEIEQACSALEVCCANALRYGGKDKKIIARLGMHCKAISIISTTEKDCTQHWAMLHQSNMKE